MQVSDIPSINVKPVTRSPKREPMTSDSVHSEPSGMKFIVENKVVIPVIAIDVQQEDLLFIKTLWTANGSKRCQLQLLSKSLNSRTGEDDMSFRQFDWRAEVTRSSPLIQSTWKSWLSVAEPCIGQAELGDRGHVLVFIDILKSGKSWQRLHIWQSKGRNRMVSQGQRPLH